MWKWIWNQCEKILKTRWIILEALSQTMWTQFKQHNNMKNKLKYEELNIKPIKQLLIID